MSEGLKITPPGGQQLALPLEYVTSRAALLGMSGSGKSNAGVVIAEEMFAEQLPWIVIDPKGDYWGIRSSKDGSGVGLPVAIFGGMHADVPLDPQSGTTLGKMVAAGDITHAVFDVSEFDSDSDMIQFLTDFGRSVYKHNREPLHLFCEEMHLFCNQDGSNKPCADVWKKIASQGRFHGIGMTMISQRPQKLHKDVLSQAETLIAMRVTAKRDRDAIDSWVSLQDGGSRILNSLSQLPDGAAWVWSPQRFNLMRQVRFRRRTTYDSGKTPEVGAKVRAPKMAVLDIERLQERFAELYKSAGTDDPEALRKEISRLQGEIDKLQARPAGKGEAAKPEIRLMPVFNEEFFDELGNAIKDRMLAQMSSAFDLLSSAKDPGVLVEQIATNEVGRGMDREFVTALGKSKKSRLPGPSVPKAPKTKLGKAAPSRCAQLILNALVQHKMVNDARTAAIVACYAPSSGNVSNAVGELRRLGLVEGPNAGLTVTTTGYAHASAEKLPLGEKLMEKWQAKLQKAPRQILEQVWGEYPKTSTLAEAAVRAGYPCAKGVSGNVSNAVGRLRSLELVRGKNSALSVNAVLAKGAR